MTIANRKFAEDLIEKKEASILYFAPKDEYFLCVNLDTISRFKRGLDATYKLMRETGILLEKQYGSKTES